MALSIASTSSTSTSPRMACVSLFKRRQKPSPRNPAWCDVACSSSSNETTSKRSLRVFADAAPRARFVARRRDSVSLRQLRRPLIDYMSLPASQYSVLDAERIERVDDNTFRCYVYRFKFFNFEVCPVLLVKVEEQPNGCCIRLLSCKLEGSPVVVAQNDKFDGRSDFGKVQETCNEILVIGLGASYWSYLDGILFISFSHWWPATVLFTATLPRQSLIGDCSFFPALARLGASMVNWVSCSGNQRDTSMQQITSDATIEVNIEVPFAFRIIPIGVIEATGTQVLDQILRLMLPRFLAQLVKDYQAWASGDTSRQPLGTGEI